MNKHEPAFPFTCQGPTTGPEFYYGLTKYEEVAARFMAALMANGKLAEAPPPKDRRVVDMMSTIAFEATDAFFAELERRAK